MSSEEEQTERLAEYIRINYPQYIGHGGRAVDIAIRIIEDLDGK